MKHQKETIPVYDRSQSLSVPMKGNGPIFMSRTTGKDYFYLPIEFESLPWESYTKGDIQKLRDFLSEME